MNEEIKVGDRVRWTLYKKNIFGASMERVGIVAKIIMMDYKYQKNVPVAQIYQDGYSSPYERHCGASYSSVAGISRVPVKNLIKITE